MNIITIQVNLSLKMEGVSLKELAKIQEILKFGEDRLDNDKVIDLLALDRRPLVVTTLEEPIEESQFGEIMQNTVTIEIIG